MANAVDFYFDFSSPYGYLASERIDDIAARHGRTVEWHPMLLGVVFKQTGMQPLTQIPLKGEYAARDFARTARMLKIPFAMPSTFPIPSQAPARIVLWLKDTQGAAAAKAYVRAAYRKFFVDGVDISAPATAAAIAAELGHDRDAAAAAIEDPKYKAALKSEVEGAIARGVFGSPFFVVDGEPFWGADRLPMLEEWLRTGGW